MPTHTHRRCHAHAHTQLPTSSTGRCCVCFPLPPPLPVCISTYLSIYIHSILIYRHMKICNLNLDPLRPSPPPPPAAAVLVTGYACKLRWSAEFSSSTCSPYPPTPRFSMPLQTANLMRLKAISGCHMAKFNAVSKREWGKGGRGRRCMGI